MARTAACVLGLALFAASTASAADRIYWADRGGGMVPPVAFADLDSTGGHDLDTSGATSGFAEGLTIDAAAGRVYWANDAGNRISFADLGGGGGGDLATPGVTTNSPNGLSIDPAAGRIYWADYDANKIFFANLNGSGGGEVTTTGATISSPLGTAIDPAGGRIYWANNSGATAIGFARLDGSGGADLNTMGATVNAPWGLALDLTGGRVYWANSGGSVGISFARLDGTGGGDLPTPGAPVVNPSGPAIDSSAGRIYWTNEGGGNNTIAFANLDGSGGATINTTGASRSGPVMAALLKSPLGAGAPTITGGTEPGSVLSCTRGSWEPDLLGARLYRVPASFNYQWTLDGADIAGATASSHTADREGTYRCRVTAANAAGSSSQTSDGHVVALPPPPAFGPATLVTLALARKRIPARGPVPVRVANGNDFDVTGVLAGRTSTKVTVSRRRFVRLRAKAFTVGPRAATTVKLRLPKPLRRLLRRTRRLSLRLTATVRDPSGNTRTVRKRVSPRLKQRRRR